MNAHFFFLSFFGDGIFFLFLLLNENGCIVSHAATFYKEKGGNNKIHVAFNTLNITGPPSPSVLKT